MAEIVVPGDRLGTTDQFIPGADTFVDRDIIYSAVVGYCCTSTPLAPSGSDPAPSNEPATTNNSNTTDLSSDHESTSSQKKVLFVSPDPDATEAVQVSGSRLPPVGSLVWGRVTRVLGKVVYADVYSSSQRGSLRRVYHEPSKGQIRYQDISPPYSDEVLRTAECFKSGDIIKAKIIAIGDARGGCFLSTLDPECGVVMAQSTTGGRLVPVAYNLMRCEQTGAFERRKVARPTSIKK